MKKLYILPLIALFFSACSTDDSAEILNQVKIEDTTISNARLGAASADPKDGKDPVTACFSGLNAHVSMDVSGGLNNPIVNFVADVPLSVSSATAYTVKVEVQQLADCEDFNVITGNPIYFGGGTYTNTAVASPSISVLPYQLPVCYKWRMVFEKSSRLTTTCKTVSPWYDAPLF